MTEATGTVGTGSESVNPNPGLGSLVDNGGTTLTPALLTGSPAINAGDNSLVILDDEDIDKDDDITGMIPFDARGPGDERLRWRVVDSGAVESSIQPRTLPSISLLLSPQSVAENGTSSFKYTFTRTGSTADTLSLNYTLSGSTTAGVDYDQHTPVNASIKTVTMAAGTNTATVVIKPTPDNTMEVNETVSLQLAASSSYKVATRNSSHRNCHQ